MTREEAIRILASSCIPGSKQTEALETLIPELAECEDERMINALWNLLHLHYAQDDAKTLVGIEAGKFRKWLEKQKEQKVDIDKLRRDIYQSGYNDGYQHGMEEEQKEQLITANDLDEEINRFFDDCIDVHEAKLYGSISERVIPVDCYELTARHFAKWGEMQKEQKPVQTEDEREYVRTLKSLIADFIRGKEEVDRSYYQKIYDWLDGRHIEQKPADLSEMMVHKEPYIAPVPTPMVADEQKPEWSEEDERNIRNLESIVYYAKNLPDETRIKLSDFLKSLRSQPKRDCKDCAMFINGECTKPHWKPSDDEERLINTSISFLKDFADKGYENAVECIDWLKSKLNEKSINA